jgi:hypothetical protein
MKRATGLLGIVCLLAFSAAASAQVVGVAAPATVSYLNPGRYLVFQGTYVNDKGAVETGLVKYDSQTGLTWLLRPVPATNETAAGFAWTPVKN